MKQKTEIVLTAFTAACSVQSSIPLPETDEPEMTDEQIEALADRKPSAVWLAACDLLEAIKAEERAKVPFVAEDDFNEREEAADKGLVTEVNRSRSLVNVSDTVNGCEDVLRRHPFGFRNGSRDSKGRVSTKPFTAAENLAAEKWLESIKNGSPVVVAEDEAD